MSSERTFFRSAARRSWGREGGMEGWEGRREGGGGKREMEDDEARLLMLR